MDIFTIMAVPGGEVQSCLFFPSHSLWNNQLLWKVKVKSFFPRVYCEHSHKPEFKFTVTLSPSILCVYTRFCNDVSTALAEVSI